MLNGVIVLGLLALALLIALLDQFVVAGQAWQLCRAGQADPDQFGIFD